MQCTFLSPLFRNFTRFKESKAFLLCFAQIVFRIQAYIASNPVSLFDFLIVPAINGPDF